MAAMLCEESPKKKQRKAVESDSSEAPCWSPRSSATTSPRAAAAVAVAKPSPIPRLPRPMSEQQDSASDFEPLRLLGKGAFGAVVLVRRRRGACEGARFAMKVMSKRRLANRNLQETARVEQEVLRTVRHPCLVHLCYSFQSRTRLYLVTAYYEGGALDGALDAVEGRRLGLATATKHACRLAVAIDFLHASGVIHRDIKAANVLLDRDGRCYLADFGLAAYCDDAAAGRSQSFAGTLVYMAPELFLKSRRNYDGAVDFWSLGVLLYEMLVGATPFEAPKPRDLFRNILHEAPDLAPLPSDDARRTVSNLLAKDAKDRHKLAQLRCVGLLAQALDEGLDEGDLEAVRARAATLDGSFDHADATKYLSHEGESLCKDVRADLFAGFAWRGDQDGGSPIAETREASVDARSTSSSAALSSGISSCSDDAPRKKKPGFLSRAGKTLAKGIARMGSAPRSPQKPPPS